MTTCTYCKCEVSERDAAPDDVARHRDLFVCSFALMRVNAALWRRVAELEELLVNERSYAATLEDRLELYTGNPPLVQTAED